MDESLIPGRPGSFVALSRFGGDIEALTAVLAWFVFRVTSMGEAELAEVHEAFIQSCCHSVPRRDDEPLEDWEFAEAQRAAAAERYDTIFMSIHILMRGGKQSNIRTP